MKEDGFSGSCGLYLWELFFHIPLLVSARFLTLQDFDNAERWLKRLFNSSGYRDAEGKLQNDTDRMRYWNTLPLQDVRNGDGSLPPGSADPDVIAMHDPVQYKLAVFMRTLDLLISRGDQAYRQQERDTLVEAKMHYLQASRLLGSRPVLKPAGGWKEASLGDISGAPEQRFLPPYNEILLAYWDKLEVRLYNLRHNLSLDGQLLHIPVFSPPADPTGLQRQHSAGNGILSRSEMNGSHVGLYRFPHSYWHGPEMPSVASCSSATPSRLSWRSRIMKP